MFYESHEHELIVDATFHNLYESKSRGPSHLFQEL